MKKMEKLDRLTLSAIYDILVRVCGASGHAQDREAFLWAAYEWGPSMTFEWRFQGSLGFGGKVWLYNSDVPYVNCYPEDSNPSREQSVKKANEELTELFSRGKTI